MAQKDTRQGGVNISGRNVDIKGDVVGRDKITTNIPPNQTLAEEFREIIQKIDSRSEDPDVSREELKDLVSKIEQEVQKGKDGNAKKVERWLVFLASMADDIFDVTVNTLANPVLGIAKTIQLVAQKARSEYRGGQHA